MKKIFNYKIIKCGKVRSVLFLISWICLGTLVVGCSNKRQGKPKVLVFSKTEGFHHASIPAAIKAIQKLGRENGFIVDTTTNAAMFVEDSLKQYSAVIFANTTGNVLNHYQQAAFQRYIQAGGGYVGIHAASDTEYQWPWYGKLVGAYFTEHPRQQKAKLIIHQDYKFPVTDSLPNPWIRKDEWYNFRSLSNDINVLVSIDEKSYEGGAMGDRHPMVWYHKYDGGRSFYMELGHTKESYSEPYFLQLLLAGIEYAIGNNEVLDYSKATSLLVPAENRFEKVFLAGGLNEPTELTVLPNLSILIAQRRGNIKFYNAEDSTIQKVAHLEVYDEALVAENVNVETGLLGIHADPNYQQNHWVYVYYSPADTSVGRLSRFKFKEGEFKLKSEQVILEVKTDREICCHTGGSIAFGPEGNLYLSVGDNTTPFNQPNSVYKTNGYAPLDDRPGFEQYDDGRAAGNTNDLRGKILRIHVNKDGSYRVPEGNLFPQGMSKTRPEIYVMGVRNPYRISIDQHTGYLYWGDVGPDADKDNPKRGPRGYDEINQARSAGYFGWPYFVGDNYAYHQYNFATGESGPAFDPDGPINNSRNNTGLKELPPAKPAFIWYPYAQSPQFPILGSGGRTAMAGPVYYVEDYPKETRLPDYYNGKLFIYDWIRDWIMVVTMDEQGDLLTIEPFMQHTKFYHISDMEVGPDGRLYIVEYGNRWYAKNPEADLSVITYNSGNRAPVAKLKVNNQTGTIPLKVHASASGSIDPDGDRLHFAWNFGNGEHKITDTAQIIHTYKNPGVYPLSVAVSDNQDHKIKSETKKVYVGNSRPKVTIHFSGNPTFYFPNEPINYKIEVNDEEDGSSKQISLDKTRMFINVNYISGEEGQKKQRAETATKTSMEKIKNTVAGTSLLESHDCKACHFIDQKSVGPTFKAIAKKYQNDSKAKDYLVGKVLNGGSGVWGRVKMPAHPNLSQEDAQEIVNWILSLNDSKTNKSYGISGTIHPAAQFNLNSQDVFYFTATYIDHGANGVPPLAGTKTAILHNPSLKAVDGKGSKGTSDVTFEDQHLKIITSAKGWLKYSQISLKNVHAVQIHYALNKPLQAGVKVELRLDSPQGRLLGQTIIGKGVQATRELLKATLRIEERVEDGLHDLFFVFKKQESDKSKIIAIKSLLLKTK